MEEIKTHKDFINKTSKGFIVVDFYANWCGPCRMFSPVFEEVSREFKNVKFYKVNTEDNPQTPTELDIMSIPTIVFMKDGKEIGRSTGAITKEVFNEKIKRIFML